METNESLIVEGLPFALPPHLTENFEKADSTLRERYGMSPGVPALVRLWVAYGTPERFDTFVNAQIALWKSVIDKEGLKLDVN